MRVAEDDARTHRDQFVDEEHPRLEHLLVHQHESLALGRRDDRNRPGVGRERRPRLIAERGDVPAEVILDLAALVGRDDEIITVLSAHYSEAGEAEPGGSQVFDPRALDSQLGPGNGGQPDKGSDLDMVWSDLMGGAME